MCYSRNIRQHWYNGSDLKGMDAINPDNQNQLTMENFTSKAAVDILNMY